MEKKELIKQARQCGKSRMLLYKILGIPIELKKVKLNVKLLR